MATEASTPETLKSGLDIASTEPFTALQQVVGYVDRHKVASLVILALFYPSLGRWNSFADASSSQAVYFGRFHDLALATVLGTAAVHQNSHFSWQARFAYLQWTTLRSTFDKILGGSALTLSLVVAVISPLPVSTASLVLLVAWQYIVVTYHAAIRQITADSEQASHQAKLAVEKARIYVSSISDDEKSTFKIMESTCNNASIYSVELFSRVPDASQILTQNVNLIIPGVKEVTGLVTSSSQNLSKMLQIFEQVTWVSDKAKLLATHGEITEAASLLTSTTTELKTLLEIEAQLVQAQIRAHDIVAKAHSEYIVDTYKKLLDQLRLRTLPPAPAPAPVPRPVLKNKVTLRNPIALAGALNGALEDIDDKAFKLVLPFSVKIYGHSSSILFVNDNGMICLDQAPSNVREKKDGQKLPYVDGVPPYALFPLWTDLMIKKGEPHGIYYEIEGSAPNRKVTIEYYVTRFTMQDFYFHFLVILEEARPSFVTFKYFDVEDKGKEGTVGVQGGRSFKLFSFNQPKVTPGLQLVFDTSDANSMQASTFQLP